MKNNLLITPCSSAFDIRRNHTKYKFSTFNFSKINITYQLNKFFLFGQNIDDENVKNLIIKCDIEYFEIHRSNNKNCEKTFIIYSCKINKHYILKIDYEKLYSYCIHKCADYLNERFTIKIDPKAIDILEYNTPISDSIPKLFFFKSL